ncbi:hypothetical protein [Paenibacillus sp. EPM92]|uniref:hypothetical protein n=1 Tax=Paenibacillus sp. EPM92 TaxID=1561195 RepID=UPI001915F05F|nr:hypothetical protein [Paenibacillus sp. EPM92]
MRGFNIAEVGHVVNLLPPVDITGGKTGAVFSMANYGHATIIVQVGVSAAAFTKIILNECSNFAGAGAAAIPFSIYKEETTLGDTLSAREDVLATGYTPSANDNIFYVIELDGAALSEGKQFVQLSLTNGVNSVIASAVAILSGSRYAGDQSPTVIA